jgi:hypothetical protein
MIDWSPKKGADNAALKLRIRLPLQFATKCVVTELTSAE